MWAHAGVGRRAVFSAPWPNAVNTVAGANPEYWLGTVLGDGSAARDRAEFVTDDAQAAGNGSKP